MGRTVCTEPQCLYKGDLYLYPYLYYQCALYIMVNHMFKECAWKQIIKYISDQNNVEQDVEYHKRCVVVFWLYFRKSQDATVFLLYFRKSQDATVFLLYFRKSQDATVFFLTKIWLECEVGHTTDIDVLAIIIPARTVPTVIVDILQCSKRAYL